MFDMMFDLMVDLIVDLDLVDPFDATLIKMFLLNYLKQLYDDYDKTPNILQIILHLSLLQYSRI